MRTGYDPGRASTLRRLLGQPAVDDVDRDVFTAVLGPLPGTHRGADLDEASLASIEAAQNERTLCEFRAAELRQAIMLARRDEQLYADELAQIERRARNLSTFLVTGLHPVEPDR